MFKTDIVAAELYKSMRISVEGLPYTSLNENSTFLNFNVFFMFCKPCSLIWQYNNTCFFFILLYFTADNDYFDIIL